MGQGRPQLATIHYCLATGSTLRTNAGTLRARFTPARCQPIAIVCRPLMLLLVWLSMACAGLGQDIAAPLSFALPTAAAEPAIDAADVNDEAVTSEPVECELRITWGAAQQRKFQGQIRIDSGQIALRQNLSLEADSIGTIRSLTPDTLVISPHGASTFGGADLSISAPLTSQLTLRFESNTGSEPFERSIPLKELLEDRWISALDSNAASIAIQRLPHDRLRLNIPQSPPVFATGEVWQARASGFWTGVTPGPHTFQVRLVGTADGPQRIHEAIVELDERGSFDEVPFQVETPAEDGVYQLEFILVPKHAFYDIRSPEQVLRRIQFVAFDAELKNANISGWDTVLQMDLAEAAHASQPAWLGPLAAVSSVSKLAAENLNHLNPLARQHNRPPLRRLIAHGPVGTGTLAASHGSDSLSAVTLGTGAWLAIPTGHLVPNVPHRLRLRLPQDQAQRLVLSVKPINAGGSLTALGSDYEITTPAPNPRDLTGTGTLPTVEHQLLFWPGEGGCLLLLANSDADLDAAVVDIAIDQAILGARKPAAEEPTRLLGAYVSKPLLRQCFAAPTALDPATGRRVETWESTHTACERMMQWLTWSGSNLLVLNVQSDGGALLPSERLAPTPRYESEVYAQASGDPRIKDSIGLLLRHCERSGIKLVLALDLDAPLPKLPASEATGSEPSGDLYQQRLLDTGTWQPSRRYNPLHPAVQAEVRSVFTELLHRYGASPALAGIQLELDRKSQLLFVGDRWAARHPTPDGTTPSGSEWPGAGLTDAPIQRQQYLDRRAHELSEFLSELGELVAKSGSDRRLYLNATGLWNEEITDEDFFQPEAILRKPADYLLALGLRPDLLNQSPGTILLQGGPVTPDQFTADQWIRDTARQRGLRLERAAESPAAALLTEPPREFQLESPDALVDVFGPDFNGVLYPVRLSTLSAWKGRIMEQLYQSELSVLSQGSWLPMSMIPLEIQSLRERLKTVPATAFQDYALTPPNTNMRVRIGRTPKSTAVHLVNNAPWAEQVSIRATSSAAQLTYRSAGPPLPDASVEYRNLGNQEHAWSLQIPPLSNMVLLIANSDVAFNQITHSPPSQVIARAEEQLRVLESVVDRISDPTQRQEVANILGDFERWNRNSLPLGWSYSTLPGVTIQPTRELPRSGQACLQIENRNQGQVSAWIQSRPFEPPESGRLLVQAWLRSPIINPEGKVRLSLVGRMLNGERFQRSITLSCDPRKAQESGDSSVPIESDWGTVPARLFVSDMPSASIAEAFVSVELLGAGKVWIDDVEVLESQLSPDETHYVRGSMFVAKEHLARGNPFPAEQLWTSYWGRYLLDCQSRIDHTVPPAKDSPSESAAKPASSARWAENPSMLKQLRESIRDRWRK